MPQNPTRNYTLCLVSLVLLFTLCLCSSAEAAGHKKAKPPKKHARPAVAKTVATPVSREKYADILIDAQTGAILHETNAADRRHPASLTKMMTLYLAFQAIENGIIRLDTPLPVSAKAAAQSPSKLGLRSGQTIRAYDAIMGLVTQSANDAAVVLAEALAGSTTSFAEMMVRQARALGMQSTVFQNPNGLPDPDQVTSARDMAMLGYALIYHYPGFYPYFSKQSFTYMGHVYHNHNHLMERYEGMDGIKTGYIRDSGFNLVASATRGNTRLIAVVFGGTSAPSRDRQMEALLDNAFANGSAGLSSSTLPLPSKTNAAFAASTPPAKRAPKQETPPAPAPQPTAVTPPSSPPPLKQAATADGAWGIQVGAYGDVGAAQQALASMAATMGPLFKHAEQSLQKVTLSDGSDLYRARFMGLDQNAAKSACAYMVKNGHSCLVVSGP